MTLLELPLNFETVSLTYLTVDGELFKLRPTIYKNIWKGFSLDRGIFKFFVKNEFKKWETVYNLSKVT